MIDWENTPGALVRSGEYTAPATQVPKSLIVERLIAAGLLRAAFEALKLEAPLDTLTDGELALRERWNSGTVVPSDDADALALLRAIGSDPALILAPPAA